MMVTVASRYEKGLFRGMFIWRGKQRTTRMVFDAREMSAQEDAELYALRLLLRWKMIFNVDKG